MLDVWEEKATIRFGSVDRSDRLTLAGIFEFFQEAAISHAEDLGVGRDALANNGQAWVLSRFSLFVERRPFYRETIEISSWPRRWEKLFALRDYMIKDAAGNPLVRARSGWLVIDMEKRKPLRVEAIVEPMPPNEGRNAFTASPIGLNPRENLEKTGCRKALYSDIDYYGHANNARYIQWIQDAADMEILTKTNQLRLDINYLSEVKPGETVELWTSVFTCSSTTVIEGNRQSEAADYPSHNGQCFAYEGRRPGGAQAVFRAELRT